MTTKLFAACLLAVFLASATFTLCLCATTLHYAHRYTDQAMHPASPHAIHKP